MIIKKYHSYIFSTFVKNFIITSLVFFCIVVIINIFEEIRFSEKYNTEVYYIYISHFLNAPSLMFETFYFSNNSKVFLYLA